MGLTKAEAQAMVARQKAELEGVLLVTVHHVEGRPAMKYLGVVSSEVVLGTGLASELGAGLADLFGKRAGRFQTKLEESKDVALNELREKAHSAGGNAILGLDLDYSVLGGNLLMVVANGTVVQLGPEK